MSLALKIVLAVAAVGILLFTLDRLALALERRGWLYYRKRKPSSTSLGNAFLTVQSILEPGNEKVVEVRLEKKDAQDSEDGPKPGGRGKRRPAKPGRRPARTRQKGGKI